MSLVHAVSCVYFRENSSTLLTRGRERPCNCVLMLYVIHRNFLHYRTLACNFLVTMENKRKRKIHESPAAWLRVNIGSVVPGSFPGSVMEFFSSELFHGMHRLSISMFLSFVQVIISDVIGGGPCTLLITCPCFCIWSRVISYTTRN